MSDAAKVAEDMGIWCENGSSDKFILEQGVSGITALGALGTKRRS